MGQVALHSLHQRGVESGRLSHHRDGQGVVHGVAGLSQRSLGSIGIVLISAHIQIGPVVCAQHRGSHLIHALTQTIDHILDLDAMGEGLADIDIGKSSHRVGTSGQLDAGHALGHLLHQNGAGHRAGGQIVHIGGLGHIGGIQVAGLQLSETGGLLRVELNDDLIVVGSLAPVILIAH